MLFLVKKIPFWKGKCETVRCCDATASSFVAQVEGKIFAYFYAVAVKCHSSTVCPQSPFGVLKNCGAQINWASHMWFAADYSETLEVFFLCGQME
jgi:hypothetical protein